MSVTALMWCLLILPLFPCGIWVAVLLLQVICSMLSAPALLLSSTRPRVAILIPAHNEAKGIGRTLQSLLPQLQAGDQLLVVADNCDDDTAQLAAAAGAEVVQRSDAMQRGKGYALEFGMRHLMQDTPDVVIVVDADCAAETGAIDCLARACAANDRPVQALYLMTATSANSARCQLRDFAWVVRNLVRPLGYSRISQPCQLMGTGMAFPWRLLASASLGNAHLVEDMLLGIELARRGAAPLFCPQAVVRSEFPVSEAGEKQQRRRWEHGHLGMTMRAPTLLFEAIRKKNGHLLAMTLDMSVPPLALLVLLLLTIVVFAAITWTWVALQVALLQLILLALAIFLSWQRHGRDVVLLRSLLLAPFYALAKLPLYIGFLRRRQVEWVRSSRD